MCLTCTQTNRSCCVLTTWIFMKIHEHWCFSMDYHENPCFLPWNLMNVHVHSLTFIANFDWVLGTETCPVSEITLVLWKNDLRQADNSGFPGVNHPWFPKKSLTFNYQICTKTIDLLIHLVEDIAWRATSHSVSRAMNTEYFIITRN